MRQFWIDYLRVIAVIAVINIHVTSIYYRRLIESESIDWWVANIINSASRFSVPLFVMISGCVLLGRNYTAISFYKKRALRLIPPFVFFSLFYIILTGYPNDNILIYLKIGARSLIGGKAYYHMWYLTMIICLMMFYPFINMMVTAQKPKEKDYIILIVLLFIFLCLNQFSSWLTVIKEYNMSWFKRFPWYVGYFLSGYLISTYRNKIKIPNYIVISTILFLVLLGIFLNFYFYKQFNVVKDYFVLNNTGPFVYLITILIFYGFLENRNKLGASKLILSISDASFGIYLLHPFIIYLIRIPFNDYLELGFLFMLGSILITFFVSYFFISLIRKFSIARYIC